MLMRRTLAYAIDLLCVFFLYSSFAIAFVSTLIKVNENFAKAPIFSYGRGFNSFMLLLFVFCFIGYFTCSYYVSNGCSFGKYLFKLKMSVGEDGEFTIKESFLRASLQLIGYGMLSFPQIWSYLRPDQMSLIDLVCETHHSHDKHEQEFENLFYLHFAEIEKEVDDLEHEVDEDKVA